jgi:N-acetylglutamate synthase-like GNAT family acetyltransferase
MNCDFCDRNAHYKCAVCGKYACNEHSKISVTCKEHLTKSEKLNVKIRYAREKDENVIEEIEDGVILEHEEEIDEKEWERKWKGISLEKLVAEVDKRIVGFVEFCKTVNPHEEVVLMVTDLAVIPEFQDQGIGSMFFKELKKVTKESGLTKLYVSVSSNNIPAIMFHLKNKAKINHILINIENYKNSKYNYLL